MYLVAVLATVTVWVFLHFLFAIGACIVDHLLIGDHSLDESAELVKLSFLCNLHILTDRLEDLLDQAEVVLTGLLTVCVLIG